MRNDLQPGLEGDEEWESKKSKRKGHQSPQQLIWNLTRFECSRKDRIA